jgi:hypothetical protein
MLMLLMLLGVTQGGLCWWMLALVVPGAYYDIEGGTCIY